METRRISAMERKLMPLTGIPIEVWEATGITLETAFTDILDGGASGSSYTYTISGGTSGSTF